MKKCEAQFDKGLGPLDTEPQFDAEGRLVLDPRAAYRCVREASHGGYCSPLPVQPE